MIVNLIDQKLPVHSVPRYVVYQSFDRQNNHGSEAVAWRNTNEELVEEQEAESMRCKLASKIYRNSLQLR